MTDALYGVLTLLAVCALAVLPLAVVLPTAPPMSDSDSPSVSVAPPQRAGWRITFSLTRQEAQP